MEFKAVGGALRLSQDARMRLNPWEVVVLLISADHTFHYNYLAIANLMCSSFIGNETRA